MASLAKLIMAFVFSLSLSAALAQKPKPAAAKPGGTQKFIPPKLTSKLGIRSDSVTVLLEEAKQLISLPLTVTDDKKNVYTIASYQAMYKRRGVTEDEQTGKAMPISSTVIENFKTTPLSPIWIKTITEQLRVGEEIYFFDIVAKDAQGRLMFAPDLRIKVR